MGGRRRSTRLRIRCAARAPPRNSPSSVNAATPTRRSTTNTPSPSSAARSRRVSTLPMAKTRGTHSAARAKSVVMESSDMAARPDATAPGSSPACTM